MAHRKYSDLNWLNAQAMDTYEGVTGMHVQMFFGDDAGTEVVVIFKDNEDVPLLVLTKSQLEMALNYGWAY